MSDGKIVFTLKGGAGYDQPWIVISGDTVEEALGHLKSAEDAFGDIQAAAALFQGAGTAVPLTVPTPSGAGQVVQFPQQAAATADGGKTTCKHGARSRKSGTSARGPWVGYFCSLPKGHPEACGVEWDK